MTWVVAWSGIDPDPSIVVQDVTTQVSTASRDQFDDRADNTDVLDSSDPAALEPLTAFDRCDSAACSAQAYLRVRLTGGHELVFCGHHGHALSPVLAAQGAVIRDDSHLLS